MELFFEIKVKRCECDVLFYEWPGLLSENSSARLLLHPTMESKKMKHCTKKSPSIQEGDCDGCKLCIEGASQIMHCQGFCVSR